MSKFASSNAPPRIPPRTHKIEKSTISLPQKMTHKHFL